MTQLVRPATPEVLDLPDANHSLLMHAEPIRMQAVPDARLIIYSNGQARFARMELGEAVVGQLN